MVAPKASVLLAGVLCVGVISGCGSGGAATSTEPGTPTVPGNVPLVVVDGEVMLTCPGSVSFAASAMNGGATGLADPVEVEAALDALVREAGIDAPSSLRGGVAGAEWIVLGAQPVNGTERLLVGVGGWTADGPGVGAEVVELERVDGGWRAVGWGGGCGPQPVLPPGLQWAGMIAPPAGIDTSAVLVEVQVGEGRCSSGRNPDPYLHEPAVVESDESVIVYWISDAPVGSQTCPSNPMVRRVVQLHRPLGDRPLLDGSLWPPRPVMSLREHAQQQISEAAGRPCPSAPIQRPCRARVVALSSW